MDKNGCFHIGTPASDPNPHFLGTSQPGGPRITKFLLERWRVPVVWDYNDSYYHSQSSAHFRLTLDWTYTAQSSDDLVSVESSKDMEHWRIVETLSPSMIHHSLMLNTDNYWRLNAKKESGQAASVVLAIR